MQVRRGLTQPWADVQMWKNARFQTVVSRIYLGRGTRDDGKARRAARSFGALTGQLARAADAIAARMAGNGGQAAEGATLAARPVTDVLHGCTAMHTAHRCAATLPMVAQQNAWRKGSAATLPMVAQRSPWRAGSMELLARDCAAVPLAAQATRVAAPCRATGCQ